MSIEEHRQRALARGQRWLHATELRALAHPLRIALLELVYAYGPLTATRCGEVLGQSASNCSYHLRQLAKHGFIEEVPGGQGRERLWRWTAATGHSWEDAPESPAPERAAGAAMSQILRQRHAQYLADWLARRDNEPAEWQQAAGVSQFAIWLTADEAGALGREITDLWLRYADRIRDPASRPEGARLVWSLTDTFPVRAVVPPDAQPYDAFESAPSADETTDDEDGTDA